MIKLNRHLRHIVYMMLGIIACALAIILVKQKSSTKVDNTDEVAITAATVRAWRGKELIFPSGVGYFTTNGDSINSSFPTEEFKIVRYIDKKGCSRCRLLLGRYPNIIADLSDTLGAAVGFVCIMNPIDMDEIRWILRRDNQAGLTMWIDEADSLNRLNGFPEIGALQTFLVDGENRVLAIGDPAVNPRVMQLFVDVLRSDSIRERGRYHLREQVVAK